MVIDVHMSDGRTTFRLRSRGLLGELVTRQPDNTDPPRDALVRWHPQDDFVPVRLTFVKARSVNFVAIPSERELEESDDRAKATL